MKVSVLFDPLPGKWGLRGDPHLWAAMREQLAGTDLPPNAEETADLLRAVFAQLAGIDLTDPAPSAYREQYVHGGMSSGMICLDTWRQKLMPMLIERATASTSAIPTGTSPRGAAPLP